MTRVLVVDDEDVLVEMIAALIEELGHQPMIATSALEALALLEATPQPPALIITDVMMPKMNGLEFARRIREQRQLSHIPIIMMSAAGMPKDRSHVTQFIHKPFDLDLLAEEIERCLKANDDAANGLCKQ